MENLAGIIPAGIHAGKGKNYMKKKLIEIKNLKKYFNPDRIPFKPEIQVHEIRLKEQPPDKTKELLDG